MLNTKVILNSSGYRTTNLNGTNFLVVPTMMITPGEHSGSAGPINYVENEMKASVPLWNKLPLILNHPTDEKGKQTTAKENPAYVEKNGVGFIDNTQYEEGLRTECWVDENKASKVNPSLVAKIRNKENIECSTGLGAVIENSDGKNNAKNLNPDHLAVLLNAEGACSVASGCGLFNEKSQEKTNGELTRDDILVTFLENMSYSDLRMRLYRALSNIVEPWFWVTDVLVDENKVIIEYEGKYWSYDYSVGEGGVVNVPQDQSPIDVVSDRTYKPADTVITNTVSFLTKENSVDKAEQVEALITNEASPFNKEHKEFLQNQSDEFVSASHEQFISNCSCEETPAGTIENENTPESAVALTPEQVYNMLPSADREALELSKKIIVNQKTQLVTAIVNNSDFTENMLANKSIDELEILAKAIGGRSGAPNESPVQNQVHGGGHIMPGAFDETQGTTLVTNESIGVLETPDPWASSEE